jgi:hypothetical protein
MPSIDVIIQKALLVSIAAIPLRAVPGTAMSYNLFYLTIMRAFNCFKYHEVKIRILHFKATTHFFTLSTFYYERFSQIYDFSDQGRAAMRFPSLSSLSEDSPLFWPSWAAKKKVSQSAIKKKAVVALAVPP